MASLSQAFETYERPGLVVSYKLSAAKIYKGAMVGVNSSGYLAKMDHGTASLKFVGIANETGGPLKIWRQWAPQASGQAVDSGHFLTEENPDATAEALLDFMAA